MLIYRFLLGPAALALCLLLVAGSAPALTFGDVVISESYGSGAYAALCIVDFGTKSFAFHYNFSGAKTGLDMALALDTPNTGLDVIYTDWGPGYGIFIDDFAYQDQAKRETTGVYPGWAYWTSTDGVNWTTSPVGCAQRSLSNGSWDAWTYTGFDSTTWQPSDPGPVTPIPEPSSLAALCAMLGLAGSTRYVRIRKT
jgi:hypothetical protein